MGDVQVGDWQAVRLTCPEKFAYSEVLVSPPPQLREHHGYQIEYHVTSTGRLRVVVGVLESHYLAERLHDGNKIYEAVLRWHD